MTFKIIITNINNFIFKQRCLPWRVSNWFNYHCHPLYMFFMYGRFNINTLKHWENRWSTNNYSVLGGRLTLYRQVASKIPNGSFILDVGCGDGSFMNLLRDEFNVRSYGIDFSPAAIEKVKRRGFYGEAASADSIPYNADMFDVVTALELFEHLDIKTCNKVLMEMKRVCKNTGTVVISVPTEQGLIPQVEPEHLRAYKEQDIERIFSSVIKDMHVELSQDHIYWVVFGVINK